MTGWTAVDLDGTLAMHGGGPVGAIGPPVPAMLARVKTWIAEGRDVRIFTARASSSTAADLREEAIHAIHAWCLEHVGCVLPVTAEKDYGMVECWDDRAVQVVPNTGERVDGFTVDGCAFTGLVLYVVKDGAAVWNVSIANLEALSRGVSRSDSLSRYLGPALDALREKQKEADALEARG